MCNHRPIHALMTLGPIDNKNRVVFVEVIGPSDNQGQFICQDRNGQRYETESRHLQLDWVRPVIAARGES